VVLSTNWPSALDLAFAMRYLRSRRSSRLYAHHLIAVGSRSRDGVVIVLA